MRSRTVSTTAFPREPTRDTRRATELGEQRTGSAEFGERLGAAPRGEESAEHVVVDLRRQANFPWAVRHDVTERHLVDPALSTIRAQEEPVRAGAFQKLDLVALVELPDVG